MRFGLFDHASNGTRVGTLASVCSNYAISSQFTYHASATSVRICRRKEWRESGNPAETGTTPPDMTCTATTDHLASRLIRVDARTGAISTNGAISGRDIVASVHADYEASDQVTLLLNSSLSAGRYVRHYAIEIGVEAEPELSNFASRLVDAPPSLPTRHACLYEYKFDDQQVGYHTTRCLVAFSSLYMQHQLAGSHASTHLPLCGREQRRGGH